MFIFFKIKIGGVHLIEGFLNATRQRPEHSSFTTAARRQTAPPHHTHHFFCWHGPRQRSRGEMPFLYLPFFFRSYNKVFVQTVFILHYLSTCRYRLRMCTLYQWFYYCCCCLSFFPSISLFLCSRVPHTTISPYLYLLPIYFFAATTKCLYKRHSFPTSVLARIIFRFVTTGLIIGTPLYATN